MKLINSFFCFCAVCSFLITLFLCADSLAFNSVNTSVELNKRLFTFLPQGWGFFSRSPREVEVCLFQYKNGKFVKMPNYQAAPWNFFGAGRNVTRLTYEYQDIILRLPKKELVSTKANFQSGVSGPVPQNIVDINNNFDDPRLLGQYLIVMQKIIPWSWISDLDKETIDAKIVRINVHEKPKSKPL